MSKAIPLSPNSPEYKGILSLNIIYEAGLDSDSRPILVLLADSLPDPNYYDYDLILSFIMARLDEFVENDYVLVFFSSPAKYRPGWMWLLRAYRSLDRKYKKNLKALYVVHLSKGYRLIFDLANKMISPKFARKLRYVPNLSMLKTFITLAPQFIPQRVIEFDERLPIQQQPAIPQSYRRPLPSLAFGRALEDLAQLEENETEHFVPRVVLQIVQHIRSNGMKKEGIFRKSPSSEELQTVKAEFNRGITVDLASHDMDVSAALLKVFIRELPQPLIELKFSEELGALPDPSICTTEVLNKLKQKLADYYAQRPIYYLTLLKYLVEFLDDVSQRSGENRMTLHNLGVVFTPNMIRAKAVETTGYMTVPDSQQTALQDASVYLHQMNKGMALVQLLIARHENLF